MGWQPWMGGPSVRIKICKPGFDVHIVNYPIRPEGATDTSLMTIIKLIQFKTTFQELFAQQHEASFMFTVFILDLATSRHGEDVNNLLIARPYVASPVLLFNWIKFLTSKRLGDNGFVQEFGFGGMLIWFFSCFEMAQLYLLYSVIPSCKKKRDIELHCCPWIMQNGIEFVDKNGLPHLMLFLPILLTAVYKLNMFSPPSTV